MRLFITLLALLFLSVQGRAQITIERSDFTLEIGAQTEAWYVDFTNASVPEEGEGMVWDFSDLTLDGNFFVNYNAATNAAFPQANITEPTFSSLLGGLAIQQGLSYNVLDDTGYGAFGMINEEISAPLAIFTGGAGDTLTVLGGVMDYMQRRNNVQFPLNYGDSWGYVIDFEVDFLVTVAAFGLQNTPAGQISSDSSTHTVAGYGTLILPNPEGAGLDPVSLEVLMVKRPRTVTNNYTLGGMPAPQVMLDLFGLEQGESQTSTRYMFYAKGLPRTAANILVNEQGAITSFTISNEITNVINSISTASAEPVRVKAFPNPASGSFQLAFDKPDAQDWTLELYNPFGQAVHRQVVAGGAGPVQETVLLPQLPTGVYHYVLRSHTGVVTASGHLMLN
jgi:hypothetical protein